MAAGVMARAACARRGLVACVDRIDGDRISPPPPPPALALCSGVAIVAIIVTGVVAIIVTPIGGSRRPSVRARPPAHIAIAATSTACTATDVAPAIDRRMLPIMPVATVRRTRHC